MVARSLTLIALAFGSALMVAAAGSLNSTDSDFVKMAAKGGTAEVEMGHLALEKSRNADVKAFASRMIKDHTAANTKLKALASSKGVEVPSGKGIGNDATYMKLKVLSGETFDKSYVNSMVDDHKEDVAAFEKEAGEAADSEVKVFATKTLPTLKSHLEQIEKLQAAMK